MHNSIINLDELSESGNFVTGELPIAHLPRLRELLSDTDTKPIHYHLSGERDTAGRRFVRLALSATLPLFCQRCFQRFDYCMDGERCFLLPPAPDAQVLDAAVPVDDSCELLDKPQMELTDFIEEETLLSIPLAPTHPLAECPARNYIVA